MPLSQPIPSEFTKLGNELAPTCRFMGRKVSGLTVEELRACVAYGCATAEMNYSGLRTPQIVRMHEIASEMAELSVPGLSVH